MIQQAFLRSMLLGLPMLGTLGGTVRAQRFSPTREAQASQSLAAAALLAVQNSTIAQQYDHRLSTAASSDFLIALRKPVAHYPATSALADSVFAGKGTNVKLQFFTTSATAYDFAPEHWTCDVSGGIERVLCALQQNRYYAEVAPFELKGDTAVVSVRLFKPQPAAPSLDGLLVRVGAVPETLGWRVVQIRQILEDPPPGDPTVLTTPKGQQ